MGGLNENVCFPPSKVTFSTSRSSSVPFSQFHTVRFHNDPQTQQIHFHNDLDGVKCCISPSIFRSKFNSWLESSGNDPLLITGSDGSGGCTIVQFHMYTDESNELQIGMIVEKAKLGQTIKDLLKLAR